MPTQFIHQFSNYKSFIEITAQEQRMDEPSLVEKDYWIMHALYGLNQLGLDFQLKGGTSLSKGYQVIHRFSEDIDIRIEPTEDLVGFKVYTGRNQDKEKQRQSRQDYYLWLVKFLRKKIDGITSVERDYAFDSQDGKFRNGGIRLFYNAAFPNVPGVKEGILLEVGFDQVTPNKPVAVSSWLFDKASSANLEIVDNRAMNVRCYDPKYTFVEKLDAIVRKYSRFEKSGELPPNFIRHYYDVYQLLGLPDVMQFLGTNEYLVHKANRHRESTVPMAMNDAFRLSNASIRKRFSSEYKKTSALYYRGQPDFDLIIHRIASVADRF